MKTYILGKLTKELKAMSIKLRGLLKLVIDRKITKERMYKAFKWRTRNSLYKIKYRIGIKANVVEKQMIANSDWNNLIVLDACRYDFFEQVYKEYLDGKLRKVVSPSSETVEWLEKTWRGYYDLTYVSANPIINSKGVPFRGYKAAEHFSEIVDVWDSGWDAELGTVPPQNVNKTVSILPRRKKLVIHYAQPHEPFIGRNRLTFPSDASDENGEVRASVWREIIRKGVKNGTLTSIELKKCYVSNLRLVLETVAELIPLLKGKTVITADHGEMLGEDGLTWHHPNFYTPELREVPWFEVASK